MGTIVSHGTQKVVDFKISCLMIYVKNKPSILIITHIMAKVNIWVGVLFGMGLYNLLEVVGFDYQTNNLFMVNFFDFQIDKVFIIVSFIDYRISSLWVNFSSINSRISSLFVDNFIDYQISKVEVFDRIDTRFNFVSYFCLFPLEVMHIENMVNIRQIH